MNFIEQSRIVFGIVVLFCSTDIKTVFACRNQTISLTYRNQLAIIESPNYPHKYPSNLNCYWTLTAPARVRVGWNFNSKFNVGDSNVCVGDYVRLYDSSLPIKHHRVLGTFCGRVDPGAGLTAGNTLIIVFRTDGQNNYGGFQITVQAGQIPTSANRGTTHKLTVTSMIIAAVLGNAIFIFLFCWFLVKTARRWVTGRSGPAPRSRSDDRSDARNDQSVENPAFKLTTPVGPPEYKEHDELAPPPYTSGPPPAYSNEGVLPS